MSAATQEEYQLLVAQAQALIAGEDDWVANTANLSALLFNNLHEVNFAGVYRLKDGELILGPFQGQPACVHIQIGKGVCGTVAKNLKSEIVPNVHQFSGHIACDSNTNSEIVLPILDSKGNLWGVFDFDSPKLNNFNEVDEKYLAQISANIFNK
ncbi:GAF domain-containing protein [Lactobacillus sp. PV034]|uniref:GAF domain-containing protein n=1 Tax=Lactobacillus sp. PV034 TaxID=2594495 RepID=UPI002240C644|nr:GAF domain-containing protein [Lactobacillus sp. PV034]QNQ80958.1 GAF domain-containing protein [Lactobacillus sp. PV034]